MLTVHPSAGPMQEKRHPVPAIVFTPLLAAHPRVENLPTAGRTVVSGKNENRIIMNPQFPEQGPGLSHIVIDVRDHAEKGGDLIITARRADKLEQLKTELEEKHSVKVMVIAKDLSLPDSAREIYNEIKHIEQMERNQKENSNYKAR